MVTAQLNYFDMAVLGIMFLSCIFALFRGFVKEVLSLLAWVGSAFITLHFYKPFSEKLQPHFVNPMAGNIAATIILYIGSLIAFAIINRSIIKVLKSGSELGLFDNILGFLFGAVRGAFIISLTYLMISLVVKEENRPEWLEKALTRPYVEKGALLLAKIAPDYVESLSAYQKKTRENLSGKVDEVVQSKIKEKMADPETIGKLDPAKLDPGKTTPGRYDIDDPNFKMENPENTPPMFKKFLEELSKKK